MLGAKSTQVVLDTEGNKLFCKEFPFIKPVHLLWQMMAAILLFSILPIEAAENAE